jgi:hypothetical protein
MNYEDESGEYWSDDDGHYHREDGPACIWKSSNNYLYYEYFQHGKRHRLDGPAIDFKHLKEWYINGIQYSEEEFLRVVKMKVLL